MNVMKRAVLLLLVVAVGSNADTDPTPEGAATTPSGAATTPDPCHGLKNTVKVEDLHQFNGDWVLVWSVSDHDDGRSMLANLSSSHVELHADNDTFIMIERNLYTHDSKCRKYSINEALHHDDKHTDNTDDKTHNHHGDDSIHADSVKEEVDGLPTDYNDPGILSFYESCPDCLLIIYKWGEAKFLLGYGKHGHHQDDEKLKTVQEDHKQRALCLGFTHEKPYSYDGKAELAHKKCAPPTENPTDHAAENPTENTAENPTEHAAENPTEHAAENPTENTAENPTEHATEQPATDAPAS